MSSSSLPNRSRLALGCLFALALGTAGVVLSPSASAAPTCDPIKLVCTVNPANLSEPVNQGGVAVSPLSDASGSAVGVCGYFCTGKGGVAAVGWWTACSTQGGAVLTVGVRDSGQCDWTCWYGCQGPKPLVAIGGERACGTLVSVSAWGPAECRGQSSKVYAGTCLLAGPTSYKGGTCGVGVRPT